MSGHDAMFAQLLGMGFDPEAIEECQVAMATSSQEFSVQAATEWLLQQSQNRHQRTTPSTSQSPPSLTLTSPTLTSPPLSSPPHTSPPVTSPPSQPDIQKAQSSGGVLTSYNQPLKSRHHLGEEQAREKKRYEEKEREEIIRKSKERRLADIKARQQLKKQIEDDRRARQTRGKATGVATGQSSRGVGGGGEQRKEGEGGEGGGGGEGGEGRDETKKIPSTCRVQIRLPSGKVLRHSLSSSATLSEVAAFVMTSEPRLTSVQLVQPFPHHEFSPAESLQTLLSLGLCPSASLVVRKRTSQSSPTSQTGGQASMSSTQASGQGGETGSSGQAGSTTSATGSPNFQQHLEHTLGGPPPFGGPRHYFGNRSFPHTGGHVLGDGGNAPMGREGGREGEEEKGGRSEGGRDEGGRGDGGGGEEMEVDRHHHDADIEMEDRSPAHSDMESDSDDDIAQPIPHPPGNFPMPPRPNFGPLPPHPMGPRRPRMQFPGMPPLGGGEIFGGEGHKLGGKNMPMLLGDAQLMREEAGRLAARKRTQPLAVPTPPPERAPRHLPSVPSLESLCTRTLVSLTASYGLPSCSSLTPRAAHQLLSSLRTEGRLNPKTLSAFHGCPIHTLILDNYPYATNELLGGLWLFPSLTHLSLGSCTIITDRAIASLFPYLNGLTHLNLEGCRQLTDAIFRPIRCCTSLETLRLGHVKATDRGLQLLLHYPLQRLRQLDLSHTHITSTALSLLPQGTPVLEELSLEATEVKELSPLCRLPRLHSLNIAHCQCGREIGSLSGCGQLTSLNLSGVPAGLDGLQLLSGLRLTTLKLPDRNSFFDDAMETVSRFPLTSLNLMDYCYVTDVGVANIITMTTLTELSLSRTKLTDTGMQFVGALTSLRHLSLDNTVVTDAGLLQITDLVCLESLSLSDTRVTSAFILWGALDKMSRLNKLNLSRTAVCDQGATRLILPSLIMLNLDWTCVSELITLEFLREKGCPVLETLRNRNIGQPLPGQQPQQQNP